MNEISALTATFTAIQDITKALISLRDFEKLNAKVLELQHAIITAQQQAIAIQQSYTLLEAKTRELEAECMRLKDWSSEKEKYAIREIASGVFAYVEKKQPMDPAQRAHKYCCNCFDRSEKSLLQQTDDILTGIELSCPRCGFRTVFRHYK